MKNFLIGLVCMIGPFFSFGHNPLSARYYLEAGEHGSLLTINLSQDGINQTLLKKYSKARLEEMQHTEFEELIVDYVKSNFHLSFDEKVIELGKGGIKLGSHQTDLKFVLPPILQDLEKIEITIPAFKENGNHQSIFSYNANGKSDHVILSASNNYQSSVSFLTPVETNIWLWIVFIVSAGLVAFILLKLNQRNKELNHAELIIE